MPSFCRNNSGDSLSLDLEDLDESPANVESISISSTSEHSKYRRFSSMSNVVFGSHPDNSSDVVNIINLRNIIKLKLKRKKLKTEDDFFYDTSNNSSEHCCSFHRDRSVQRLVDVSTCVSTLIDDSEESGYDSNYESSDEMTSSIASFAIDGFDEKHQDPSYQRPFFQEEGVKLPNYKQRGFVSSEETFSESFHSIDDPIYEEELQPIGSSKKNTN